MQVIYARISTPNQNFERQLSKEKKAYIDVCSGSVNFKDRTEAKKIILNNAITSIEVNAVDRLGRNLTDILNTLEYFTDKGVNIIIENLGMNTILPDGTPNPFTKLIISVLGTIAEFEKKNLKERVTEGIKIAKAKGIYKGRVRGSVKKEGTYIKQYKHIIDIANSQLSEGKSLLSICKNFNEIEGLKISRTTLIKMQKDGLIIERKK